MAVVQTRWKHKDSPNVANSCWGYSFNGRFVEHNEENIFEAPPTANVQGDIIRFNYKNRKYAVEHASAWFHLDAHNDIYDIVEAY